MNLLSVKDLCKIGRETTLFKNVTFGLNEGEKAALIGKNGTGKSTLLNCIAGNIRVDEGTAVFNKDAGISFLPQIPQFNPEDTISDHIFKVPNSDKTISATSPKLAIIKEYENLCEKMASSGEEGFSDSFKRQFESVSKLMDDKNLWSYEAEIKSILTVLGISGKTLNQKMKELSGGMVKKVALAQVLVEDTKLLLLDEPTNHLDIDTITWLEEWLCNTKKAVLMVTHDRYFLDSVCSDIYELENGKFSHYKGNFSTYLDKKATEMEIAQNTERRIESVLRTERDWLLRGPCARGTKARARVDNIHRLINREKLKADKEFAFEVGGRRLGGKILELHNISKNYAKASGGSENTKVLDDFSYIFKKGERIGVVGENGSGKSTLLNIVTQNLLPDSGDVEKGINTVFGYYEQNPVFKDMNLTVLEYIKEAAEYVKRNDGKTLSAAQMLEQFAFEGKIQYSPVSALSGGERKRLYLVRLLISNPNFLVLDEPTNDFDIFTMSILESFLQDFGGCLLVVSHDRYFMDKIADTLFILEKDGSVSGFVGKCSEYLDYKKECEKAALLAEKEKRLADEKKSSQKADSSSVAADSQNTDSTKSRKRTFKEQKEYEQIEEEIFSMEDRKSELEGFLSGGETNHEKLADYGKEYATLSDTLEKKYARWEELGLLKDY